MVVHRSTGKKVGAMSLEGEASKAHTITCQAVIALCGARFEDTFFPTIAVLVAGFPLEWHWVNEGTRGVERMDNRGDRSSGGGKGIEEVAQSWTGREEVEVEVDGCSSWCTVEAGWGGQTGQWCGMIAMWNLENETSHRTSAT